MLYATKIPRGEYYGEECPSGSPPYREKGCAFTRIHEKAFSEYEAAKEHGVTEITGGCTQLYHALYLTEEEEMEYYNKNK